MNAAGAREVAEARRGELRRAALRLARRAIHRAARRGEHGVGVDADRAKVGIWVEVFPFVALSRPELAEALRPLVDDGYRVKIDVLGDVFIGWGADQ